MQHSKPIRVQKSKYSFSPRYANARHVRRLSFDIPTNRFAHWAPRPGQVAIAVLTISTIGIMAFMMLTFAITTYATYRVSPMSPDTALAFESEPSDWDEPEVVEPEITKSEITESEQAEKPAPIEPIIETDDEGNATYVEEIDPSLVAPHNDEDTAITEPSEVYTQTLTKSSGVNYYNGRRETYYSSNVLYHYRTGEWTPDANGFYHDANGYFVVAASDMSQGTVFEGSMGPCIVLDSGCAAGVTDYYVNW